MSRTNATFYIVSSSTGVVIESIKNKRRQGSSFANGPYVKVAEEVFCFNKGDGDDAVAAGILHIPKEINPRDITASGHLRVKRVDVSSYSAETTAAMAKFFYNASKLEVYHGFINVETLVGKRDVKKVIAMIIGKSRRNLNAIVKREAKVYTRRNIDPYIFRIDAYSVKKMLGVKIRLEKAIHRLKNDLDQNEIEKQHAHPSSRKVEVKKSQNPFDGLLGEDADGEDGGAPSSPSSPRPNWDLPQVAAGDVFSRPELGSGAVADWC